jgi:hypothetical protein
MAAKRMTKGDVPRSFGAFKPVGHIVVAFENDERATQASQSLRQAGFEAEDILQYSAVEEMEEMEDLLGLTTGTAEFGHEVALMRRYRELAAEGCGWLIIYAPDDSRAQVAATVVRQHGAKIAERYGRLVVEDMI